MSLLSYQPRSLIREIEQELFPVLSALSQRDNNNYTQPWAPKVDIIEEKDKYLALVEVPGVDPKDIDIEMDGHTLTIRGEKKSEHEEKGKNFHRVERSVGTFFRQFNLPDAIDSAHIDAKTAKGVLTITLPKLKEERTKKIQVKGE